MTRAIFRLAFAIIACIDAGGGNPLAAQQSGFTIRWMVHGVVAGIHTSPVPGGGDANQVAVIQPLVMVRASGLSHHLTFDGTLNLEGLTMSDGVLTLGAWGEGFIDRRHPHTYLHEAMVSWVDQFGGDRGSLTFSISAGKGFVPFGSDDPMVRPALRYPVNHHWSQILERAVVIAGWTAGPLTAEVGLFNGDEPERPGQWPRISHRFGDSWSVRGTLIPLRGVELSGSHARVHSPENRSGAATDQRKWHLSGRVDRSVGRAHLDALAEWARTTEADGFFDFHTALGEVQLTSGAHRVYYQFERSERPEEERTVNPFRSLRPHLENSILGTTRWAVQTAGYAVHWRMLRGRLQLEPIIEGSYARVTDVGGGLFSTVGLYGRRNFWSLTTGLRLTTPAMHRMGRYGVAAAAQMHLMADPE